MMKLKTKKLIAREIILVTIVFGITGVGFLSTYPYNTYLQHEVSNYTKEITETGRLADSLSDPYKSKTVEGGDYISRVYRALTDLGYKNLKAETIFRKDILSDSTFRKKIFVHLKYNLDGFSKSQSQFEAALKNQLTEEDIESSHKAKALEGKTKELLHKQEKVKSKLLTTSERSQFSLQVLIVLTLLLYILRPFVYLLRWSFLTMRQTG